MEDVLPEESLRAGVDLLVRLVEAAGALVVFAGALLALFGLVRELVQRRQDRDFAEVRLGFGRYLVLGLEFQLAADVLSTAVAPSFEEIGKLAAVATIRTVLSFVLARETARERAEVDAR